MQRKSRIVLVFEYLQLNHFYQRINMQLRHNHKRMEATAMNKKECRKKLLEKRNKISLKEAKENSTSICEKLKTLPMFHHVMVYLATGNECNLDSYITEMMEKGASVYVPVCTGKGTMEASLLKNIEEDIEIGTFGIRAPKKEAQRFVSPENLDAVIVPGVGFDKKGNRLGFGGGFYDRYLPKTRQDCKKIAVCHEMQLLENAYPEKHDFPMDGIITEKKIYLLTEGNNSEIFR